MNYPVLWVDNYKRKNRPEYNEPKTLLRHAAHKKKPKPDREKPRKSKETSSPSRKEHQNPRTVDNPPLAQQ